MTLEQIVERCKRDSAIAGIEFTIPVSINNRLKTTLGRCMYKRIVDYSQDSPRYSMIPTKIEISKKLFENGTDKSIIDVVDHEVCHYIATAITHQNHGHDAVFKRYCAMIGTQNDGMYDYTVEYKKDAEPQYKFDLYCSCCGKRLGGRHRHCALVDHPENYMTKCCSATIKVVQNF